MSSSGRRSSTDYSEYTRRRVLTFKPISVNLILIIEADCSHRLTANSHARADGVISWVFEQQRVDRLFTADADAQVVIVPGGPGP